MSEPIKVDWDRSTMLARRLGEDSDSWEPCESCSCALTREPLPREVWSVNGGPATPTTVHTVERCRVLRGFSASHAAYRGSLGLPVPWTHRRATTATGTLRCL